MDKHNEKMEGNEAEVLKEVLVFLQGISSLFSCPDRDTPAGLEWSPIHI